MQQLSVQGLHELCVALRFSWIDANKETSSFGRIFSGFVVEVELERKMSKNSNPVDFVNSEWHLCEGSAPLEHLRQEQMEMQRDIDQNQICAD